MTALTIFVRVAKVCRVNEFSRLGKRLLHGNRHVVPCDKAWRERGGGKRNLRRTPNDGCENMDTGTGKGTNRQTPRRTDRCRHSDRHADTGTGTLSETPPSHEVSIDNLPSWLERWEPTFHRDLFIPVSSNHPVFAKLCLFVWGLVDGQAELAAHDYVVLRRPVPSEPARDDKDLSAS